MKTIAAFLLGLGILVVLDLASAGQDNKDVKKEDKKEIKDDKKAELPPLEGKYKLVGGKINDKAIGDDAKSWEYTFTTDKITIKGVIEKKDDKKDEKKDDKKDEKKDDKKDEKKDDKVVVLFVIGYKIDAKATPANIDMEILEGPDGTKGIKASGIIEMKADILKLAYIMEKDKRAKNFDGKEGNMFELKKVK